MSSKDRKHEDSELDDLLFSTSLADQDGLLGEIMVRSAWRHGYRVKLTVGLLITVASILLLVIASSDKDGRWETDCGSSPTDAAGRKCRFDLFHYAWIPEACVDIELMDTFLSTGNFTLRDAFECEDSISCDKILEGDIETVLITKEFKARQCQYSWEKLRRSVLLDVGVDSRIGDVSSMDACADYLTGFPALKFMENKTYDLQIEYLACSRSL